MHVIVSGAGQVGQTVSRELSEEHEVTVIDSNPRMLDEVPFSLEAVHGDATNLEVLQEAGIDRAQMLISCTSDDRTNILVCSTAKIVSEAFTIARVSDPSLLETWQYSRKAFGVDRMVGRASLTAKALVEVVGFQSERMAAREVQYFSGGRVQLAEFDVYQQSPLVDGSIEQADRYEGITYGAIFRDGELIMPRGDESIYAGDRLVVIGDPDRVKAFGSRLNPEQLKGEVRDVVILGGGQIGYETARLLEERDLGGRLVETDPNRARFLAENLPDTLVLEDDATRSELWEQEQLDRIDMMIVTLRPDERNLLVSQLGKVRGVPRVVSVVHEREHVPVFESVDLDRSVHPREEVADEISRYALESYAEHVSRLEHEQAEVFEKTVDADSPFVGRSLREIQEESPLAMVVGAVTREGRVIVPRGDTQLQASDRVVVLSSAEEAEEVSREF